MNSLLKITCLLGLASLPLCAQEGDKKHPDTQKAPIPADEIPPSPFLGKDAALKSFEVADGFVIENIAEGGVHQPVSLSFDADGRAWVVEMTNYMLDVAARDEMKPGGRIKVLEDSNGDGSLDKVTVFLDNLILPRACAVTSDGLLYAHNDQLFFIKRGGESGLTPEGDPVLIDENYAAGGNPEHKSNGLLLARDNWYYNAKSGNRYRRVNGKWVKEKTAFRGQWGIAQDDAGRLFHNNNSTLLMGDNTRPNLYRHNKHYVPKHKLNARVASNRVYPIRINPGVNRAYQGNILNKEGKLINVTAASGMGIYRGHNFPKEYYGTAFIAAPCSNLIKAIKVGYSDTNQPKGEFTFKEKEFVASTDEWFRPVNVYTAPDGTLWVVDIYMGLLQHKAYLTTYLRKQYLSRGLDKPKPNNGRLYRVRYVDGELGEVPKLSKATMEQLQLHLGHENGAVRDTAQRLIVERITTNTDDYAEWNRLNTKAISNDFSLLNTLWAYESMKWVPQHLIEQALGSENSDLVNSALELASYSSESEVSKVLSYEANPKTAVSYVFSLGKMATAESHAKAVAVIAKFSKQAGQLEAAYVSGLGANAAKVTALNLEMGKGLAKMLKDAAKAGHGKIVKAPEVPLEHKKRYDLGKNLYRGAAACSGCHGLDGEGQAELFPPLVGSEWVADADVMAKIIIHGLEGPIKVNGQAFKGDQAMPAYKDRVDLSSEDLASIMTYIRHMKGNKGGVVTAEEVDEVKEETRDRAGSYTDAELRKELE